ncbi:acylase [Agarilytica rhodophyticola]|uniref:acylase n=1 Tax=Agarilytica rhodophyticola TaxID=1737490 RepID=UPI000B3439BF|nr:acylase [Agarilytica rhodophyticola]
MKYVSSYILSSSATNKQPLWYSFKICSITLLFSTFIACSKLQPEPTDTEFSRLQERANAVEIIRDNYGVPHIYAKTDADAVFGLLYAQAEDDFKRIERNYVWAMGRLAEIEGEEALYSDLRVRLYMTLDQAKIEYQKAPQWLKDLCIAFADGLNFYLKTHPHIKPKLITQFEPWMPMFFFEGSIGGDIEKIPLDGIKAFYGSAQNIPLQASIDSMSEPKGSNGFAISGKLTESGNAMLLINPHTSFYFRGEVHVVSEEGLNAYGAVTWGQFFIYQGFNEHNGWMHTSTYADFKDEFIEDIFTKNGQLYYKYGNESRKVEESTVTLKYRDGNVLKNKEFSMYHTHHGPITHMIDNKWVATKINWEPAKALEQSYIRTKTRNHKEFHKMMDIRTNSSNNTVYADSQGNIAYYHGNFMPRRNAGFNFSKPVDGSNPKTDWQGLHELDEMITLLNPDNGWLQNCNSTPFNAALEFSPKSNDYPTYMAPDAENYRGIHAVSVLAGQDNFTLDKLIALSYDPFLPAFAELIPSLIGAFDKSKNKDKKTSDAIEVLRKWDFKVSEDSVAMSLAHFYGMHYLNKGNTPEGLKFVEKIRYFSNDTTEKERLKFFSEVLIELENDFGKWNIPWGEVNRFQRLNGSIASSFDDTQPSVAVNMASGRWGALAAYGSRRFEGTKKLYGYRGNSFIAVVEFGKKVKAKSLLAGGQSGDPLSPHFNDQIVNYVNTEFKDVAYYREDVEKRATERYTPGDH